MNNSENCLNFKMEAFEAEYDQDLDYQNDPEGFSQLHYAAKINSKEIGAILIIKGAKIDAKDLYY